MKKCPNIPCFDIAFIVSLAFSLQSSIYTQVFITAFWGIMALLKFIKVDKCDVSKLKKFRFIFLMFVMPQILIHLYTVILIIFKCTLPEVLSTNLVTYSGLILVIISIYLFEKKALTYAFISLILSWVFYVGKCFYLYGFEEVFIDSIKQAWFGISIGHKNYFELHEVVLCIGYFFICYIFTKNKKDKLSLYLLIGSIIVFMLGFKRIGGLALATVALFCILLHYLPKEENKYKLCILCGIAICVVSFLFIYILSSGGLFNRIIDFLKIDTMARNYFFEYIMSFTFFSPFFLGYGRGGVKIAMLNEYTGFTSVHSDLIKMYFEIGFVFFIVWLVYYFIFVTKTIDKTYNRKSAIFYLVIMLYTFVLFSTDNTESYFICNYIRVLAPMIYAMYIDNNQDNLLEL